MKKGRTNWTGGFKQLEAPYRKLSFGARYKPDRDFLTTNRRVRTIQERQKVCLAHSKKKITLATAPFEWREPHELMTTEQQLLEIMKQDA